MTYDGQPGVWLGKGDRPGLVPPRESTESTVPEYAAGPGAAAPTVVPAPAAAWSAPASGWPSAPPAAAGPASGPMPAASPGYGYPAPGGLPPQGWTAPQPQLPVNAPAQFAHAPATDPGWQVPGPAPASPAPRRGRMGLGVLVGVLVACLVLGAGAVAWFVFLQPEDETSASPSSSTTDGDSGLGAKEGSVPAPSAAGTGEGSGTTEGPGTGSSPSTSTTSAAPVDPQQAAVAELDALARAGQASTMLDGRWVAQLASKSDGIFDPLQVAQNGTHYFYGTDILFEHETLVQTVGGSADVFVLFSTDFGQRSTDAAGRPYWVTLADGGFASREAVLAWCERTFPTLSAEERANACVPRTLEPPHD